MRFSRKLIHAVEAVLDIAYNAASQPVQSKEITARQGIPRRYLEQVLQQLVREGILTGVRGPKGGYLLARERRRISIGDIARVVAAGNGAGEDGGNGDRAPESVLGGKVVWPFWQEVHEGVMKKLDSVTIDDLCLAANKLGIESEAAQRLDFII